MSDPNEVGEPLFIYGSTLHNDLIALIDRVRNGVSFKVFASFVNITPFSWPEWSLFLHLSERSMQRYKKDNKTFDPLQSEKIIEITRLYQRGIEVFGAKPKFDTWLSTSCVALGGPAPKSFLDSSFGIQLIHDELGRIEHGILA
jgi:putative toxin-antitoxin system antitoxin component (TIGR02293 family)